MDWTLEEAMEYYKGRGAPSDQSALVSLLREVQQENGGGIPGWAVDTIAEHYGVKEGLMLALIRRIPSLRLAGGHLLEICAGPNCSKRGKLADFAQKADGKVAVKPVPCMRLCGKGPNIRWDGKLYHGADEALIRKLLEEAE